jgi:hypothetical protein
VACVTAVHTSRSRYPVRAEAPDRSGRAFGAMIFAVFGAAWLAGWCWFAQRQHPMLYVLVAAAGAAIFVMAWRTYSLARSAASQVPADPQERRTGRAFTLINVAQWVAIVVGVNVLNNTGLGRWDVPWMILVVGVHFLALVPVFRRRSHAVTGAALIVLAVAYPLFATGGPDNAVGLLGTGLILWASALWALRPASPARG